MASALVKKTSTSNGSEISFYENGVLTLIAAEGSVMDVPDVDECALAIKAMVKDQYVLALVDISKVGYYTFKARQHLKKSFDFNVKACACVSSSPLGSIILNFIIKVSGLPYPNKFFLSTSEAHTWLLNQQESL